MGKSLAAKGSGPKIDGLRTMGVVSGFNTNYLWGTPANSLVILIILCWKKVGWVGNNEVYFIKIHFLIGWIVEKIIRCLCCKIGSKILSLIPINFNKIVLKYILYLQCAYSHIFEIRLTWYQSNAISSYIRHSIFFRKKICDFLKDAFPYIHGAVC